MEMKNKTKFKKKEIKRILGNWKITSFKDAAEINPYRSLSKGILAKFVPMSALKPFVRKITYLEKRIYKGGTKFKNNDTLLAKITPCLENGKTAFINVLSKEEVASGSSEFIVLSGKSGKTDPKFLYYLTIEPNFRKAAIKSMTGTSGRQRVQNNILENILVVLPSIPEQTKIAKILSSLDDKIELNSEINITLEKICMEFFKHWFVDFEFPNEQGKPYKSSGGEFIDSEHGKIPKGWRVVELKDICNQIKPGTNFQPKRIKKGIPFLNVKNINTGNIDLTGVKYISNEDYDKVHKMWQPEENDILISRIGTLGLVAVIKKKDLPLAVHYNFINIKTSTIPFQVMYFILKSDYFQQKYNLIKKQSVQEYVTIDEVEKINLILPNDIILLKDCFDTLKYIYNKIEGNQIENQALSQIRDTLLPKLITGKIKVNLEDMKES